MKAETKKMLPWLLGVPVATVIAWNVLKPRRRYENLELVEEEVVITQADASSPTRVRQQRDRASRDTVWAVLNKRQRKAVVANLTEQQKRQLRKGRLLWSVLTQPQRRKLVSVLNDTQKAELRTIHPGAGGRTTPPGGWRPKHRGIYGGTSTTAGSILATRELKPHETMVVGVSGRGGKVPVKMPGWMFDNGPQPRKPARPELLRMADGSSEEIVALRVLPTTQGTPRVPKTNTYSRLLARPPRGIQPDILYR